MKCIRGAMSFDAKCCWTFNRYSSWWLLLITSLLLTLECVGFSLVPTPRVCTSGVLYRGERAPVIRTTCHHMALSDDDDLLEDDDEEEEIDFEKFEIATGMNEDSDELSPLLELMSDDGSSDSDDDKSWESSSSPPKQPQPMDETQRRMEQQQAQIDMLMKMVQSQQQHQPETPPQSLFTPLPQQQLEEEEGSTHTIPSTPDYSVMAPLKAMMFIDGTWLYYSIHERKESECPIVRKFGRGWRHRYRIDWSQLPRIVCEELQKQKQSSQNWVASSGTVRPIEIVRASVYTSMKNTTNKHSYRVRMYEDMKAANYDVFCMTTEGTGEKCVDIQLAVEMLHYATVPNAYDVAILLSGDKDFLPALMRTRQKGRQVGVVSMRAGCNRALYESPNVKDYNVIWIEDYLDQLLVKLDENEGHASISRFTVCKVLSDFVQKSNLEEVNSRDVGRYMKRIKIGDNRLSEAVKFGYGGLFSFVSQSECFHGNIKPTQSKGPGDKAFWISLSNEYKLFLVQIAKRTHFTKEEKEFFDTYSLEELDKEPDKWYFHSLYPDPSLASPEMFFNDQTQLVEMPPELQHDYSTFTVAQLKDSCRDFGLPVSGTKAVLLERIQTYVVERVEEFRAKHSDMINGGPQQQTCDTVDPSISEHLESLIKEYLHASGGRASSRDVGRYLSTNKAASSSSSPSHTQQLSALTQLKDEYGSLGSFVKCREDDFFTENIEKSKTYEFRIGLKKKQ